MVNQPNSQPWWTRTNKETLDDRVKAVQNVSDPTIMSDDVQRWSKIALYALLAFTTLLSGASYFKFFEKSFGFETALIMAFLLACVIEFGKNWGFLKVLRIPFFLGWRYVSAEVHNTIMWVFLLFLSAVTFAASIYNSTQGAHQLSLLLSHERTYQAFTPNTAAIDAQISALQNQDGELKLKLKNGRTNWAAQPIKAENAKTLASLQQQREATIAQQRADWEKQSSIQEQQNNFSANSLLAVGGWVELLQLILSFVRVSAERSLDKTAAQRRQQAPYPTGTGNSHHPHHNGKPNHVINEAQPQRYYFNRTSPSGNVQAALDQQPLFQTDDEKGVSHLSQTVTHQNDANAGNAADDALKLAEKEIRGWAANFNSQKHKDSTVSENINRRLDELLTRIKLPGFVPTYPAWLKFYTYINGTLFPMLDVKGWPYEWKNSFLRNLYERRPQQPA